VNLTAERALDRIIRALPVPHDKIRKDFAVTGKFGRIYMIYYPLETGWEGFWGHDLNGGFVKGPVEVKGDFTETEYQQGLLALAQRELGVLTENWHKTNG